jgi:hypothetical protein
MRRRPFSMLLPRNDILARIGVLRFECILLYNLSGAEIAWLCLTLFIASRPALQVTII